MNPDANKETSQDRPLAADTPATLMDEVADFSLTARKRSWKEPAVLVVVALALMGGYLWYKGSRYNLPRLATYDGAEQDLFTQMKCLVDYTELGKPTSSAQCRFKDTYESFWLTPKSLDYCLTYSTDNAVAAFESPKRIEFDFMCEGNDMRAVFPYQNGEYRLQEIGKTFKK